MRRRTLRAGVAVLALTAGTIAPAQDVLAPIEIERPRPSLNLYGSTGLIDMPSAEAQPDGQISISYSQFGGFARRNFNFQILPRVSGTLRYSSIEDWGRTGDPEYELYDRSFDIELQLAFEDYEGWRPSLKLGLRDFLGTGVYSGEYLVASKTIADDFTVTGGVGWGRLSGSNASQNIFCEIADSFCTRENDFGEGGEISWGTFFHGEEMGFFGGVEWRTPIEKLIFKAEYSSDAYEREQRSSASTFERNSPWNFGAEYRWREGVTFGGYYMYGSEVGFNIALSGNPNKPLTPQDLGAGPIPVNPRAADAPQGTNWAANPAARDQLSGALAETLQAEGVRLEEFGSDGRTAEVRVTNLRYNQDPKAIGRTARILAVGMPASVQTFRITLVSDGLPTSTIVIDRSDFEAQIDRFDAGEKSWSTTGIEGATPSLAGPVWRRDAFPEFDWFLAPAVYLYVLTPDDPIRLGLNLDLGGQVNFSPGLSVSGRISQPIVNTSEDPGPSETNLQPVRSSLPRYFATYTPKLARLTGDYLFKINDSTYGRASAGYLERMFAGVSGEVLWKPPDQSWGLGLELNYVAQRNFDNLGFGFYDYQVAMGLASFYWDTGYQGLEVQLDAGRYLAGDWGGTVTVTRRFANGWAVGAYATKTNVSAEDFGEGSFDKGVSISIPFRWTVPFETRARNDLALTSVSRDGGAKLDVANRLYPIVRDADRNRLKQNWGSFWQ